jgi:hypothetical protein
VRSDRPRREIEQQRVRRRGVTITRPGLDPGSEWHRARCDAPGRRHADPTRAIAELHGRIVGIVDDGTDRADGGQIEPG